MYLLLINLQIRPGQTTARGPDKARWALFFGLPNYYCTVEWTPFHKETNTQRFAVRYAQTFVSL